MERPILFNTEMVRAILDGRKTQTRRLLKPKYREDEIGFQVVTNMHGGQFVRVEYYDEYEETTRYMKPPCNPGDILWVRETWNGDWCDHYIYKADGGSAVAAGYAKEPRWHPSIHMPKEAARIFLRVKDVRAERLHEITVLDAINEGCCGTICDHANANPTLGCTDCYNTGWLESPDTEFALLWDTTVKKADLPVYGWDANPWVWVIEFERCEKPKEET